MSTEEQEKPTNEHWISNELISVLMKKLEKINKQAAKLNVPGPQLELLDTRKFEVKEKGKKPYFVPQTLIKITGEPPKLAGWTFVGTVDNAEQKGMIKMVPGLDDLFPKIEKHVGGPLS